MDPNEIDYDKITADDYYKDTVDDIPEWVFELLINIYEDDNYWDVSLQEDLPEVYEAITSIGKKYGNIVEYEKAMKLYEEYEPKVIEYYGGQMAVDYIIKEFGVIPVGIIKPPKLKSKLRAQYVEGVNYEIGKYYTPMTPEEQVELTSGLFGEEGNPAGTELPDITRTLKRTLRAINSKSAISASNIYFDTDIISRIRNGNLEAEDEAAEKHYSFDELVKAYDKRMNTPKFHDLTPEEIKEFVSDVKVSNPYHYSLMDDTNIPIDILIKKIMIRSGLDPIPRQRKKHMSRAQLERYAQYLGAEYVYDDKTMKKLVKEADKYRRNAEKEKARYEKNYQKHNASSNRALAKLLSQRSRLEKSNNDWDDD